MRLFIFLLVFAVIPFTGFAGFNLAGYGITLNGTDSMLRQTESSKFADSAVMIQIEQANSKLVTDFEIPHEAGWQTSDFYMIMVMVILLGIIRYTDVKYFSGLWKALGNPSMGSTQIRDILENSGLQNLLMNLFFAFSAGAYFFYIIRYYRPGNSGQIPSYILLPTMVFGISVLYMVKYVAVKFSGWAFKVESLTEQYLFNVFLINKVLAVVLLPFILVIGFGAKAWIPPALIISFCVAGILLFMRYIRSWQVFGSFMQFSKFHFFLYLCASEILPVSVLIKLLLRGLSLY